MYVNTLGNFWIESAFENDFSTFVPPVDQATINFLDPFGSSYETGKLDQVATNVKTKT